MQGLWSESCSRHAHLNSGFAHAIKSIAAGLCRGTFFDQVAENRRRGKDSKIDIV